MPRTPRWLVAVRDVADTQMGLITAAQLAELGVSSSTASRRVAGGMWTRVLYGVHLVDGGHPSRLQRERAAVLFGGADTRVTGVSALRHHGFRSLRLQETTDDEPERPEPVHVLIPHSRQRLPSGYVRPERTHRWPTDVVMRHGIPVVPVPRAVGDAVRRLRARGDVAAIVTEAVQRGLADVDQLSRELEEGARRGSGHFRDVLPLLVSGARSGPEVDLAELLRQAGIRDVLLNARLVTAHGEFLAVADAWLDDVGVAIEVDSVEHHSGPGFAATVRRNARYAAAGVIVVTVLPADIRDHPHRVLADILAAREAVGRGRRPDVLVAGAAGISSGRPGWRWGA